MWTLEVEGKAEMRVDMHVEVLGSTTAASSSWPKWTRIGGVGIIDERFSWSTQIAGASPAALWLQSGVADMARARKLARK
jgi:hypothetical protein